MRGVGTKAVIALLLGMAMVPSVFARATETIGNTLLNEKNYEAWPGVMPLINHTSRVYATWVNGAEQLYYRGGAEELNKALAHFAKVKVKHHVVVLRPGPAATQTVAKAPVPYDWELHVIGGIAAAKANDNPEDLEWQKDPVLTIHVTADLDLDQLTIPDGVTLRTAPGRSDEARANTAARERIAAFLAKRKARE